MADRLARPLAVRSPIVRRVPSEAELRARPPIAVTARDRQLLCALADFGFLSTELVVRAFYPPLSAHGDSPLRAAYQRLRLLWLWSLVERVELPVARLFGGRRPFLYALGPRGIPWVPEYRRTGEGPVARRRLDRFDERLLDHDLAVAAFWAHLVASFRDGDVKLERWVAEATLRAWRERARAARSGWAPSALPDGVAQVRLPDDTLRSLVLEVDMGTETLRRFVRKVRGFEAYWVGGDFRARFDEDDFAVVVVSPSATRREHLRQVAQRIVSPERWAWYRFGTFAALDAGDVAASVWVDLRNRRVPLLRD
jgi:hypothetical protein